MAANKILGYTPQKLVQTGSPGSTGTNLLNASITSLSGNSVGITLTNPYLLVTHIRLVNKDTVTRTVTLYKGPSTNTNTGSEFAFANAPIAAGSWVDWYGRQRFDNTDYLVGLVDAANVVIASIDCEVGFS